MSINPVFRTPAITGIDQSAGEIVRFDEFICEWETLSYMATNPHAMTSDDTVVGSIDSSSSSTDYVIADISADGAWLSMRVDDAPTLPAWR